jgi:hypothetical protein
MEISKSKNIMDERRIERRTTSNYTSLLEAAKEVSDRKLDQWSTIQSTCFQRTIPLDHTPVYTIVSFSKTIFFQIFSLKSGTTLADQLCSPSAQRLPELV